MNTSIEAKKAFDESGSKEKHHKIILKVMSGGGLWWSHRIADHSELSYEQVHKRMSELVRLKKIAVVDKKIVHPHRTRVGIYAKL